MSKHISIKVATRAIAAIAREYNVEQLLHTSKALASAEDKALLEYQEALAAKSLADGGEEIVLAHGWDGCREIKRSQLKVSESVVLMQDTDIATISPFDRARVIEFVGFEFPLESEDNKEDDC